MKTNQKREPMLILNHGHKGIGHSYRSEIEFKDYFIIETGKRNRQDKYIEKTIQEAKINHEKICVKTHYNFLKNKYNSTCLTNTGVSYTLLIDDINILGFNAKLVKSKSKISLKQTEFYKKIKHIKW